jgi:CheY-like chemotaxis protein
MLSTNTEKKKNNENNDNKGNNKKQRVLVVDDEKDILLALQLVLEQNSFNVSLFDNPLAALSSFKIGLYDLAILDIKMPQMNGFQLYEKIKKIDSSVKVCFITAVAIADNEERYYCDHFAQKKEEENVRQISEQHEYQYQQQQQYFYEFNKPTFLKKPISNRDLITEVNRILTS